MAPLKRWIQFLTISGSMVGFGAFFVNYGTPGDDEFIRRLSPELKNRYLKEKDIRMKADQILQRKINETKDKPAWLQGSGAMRKLDREIADEARKAYESDQELITLEQQKMQLKELAERERQL